MALDSVTNLNNKTFRVGDTVTHYDGWTGIVIGFRSNVHGGINLLVDPTDPTKLSGRDFYPVNNAKGNFCRPRDHGLGMGCFFEAS